MPVGVQESDKSLKQPIPVVRKVEYTVISQLQLIN